MTGRLVRGTILAIVLALILNLIIYFFGQSLNVSFLTQMGGNGLREVGIGPIVIVTLLTTILGAVLLWLLDRFAQDPLYLFLWIAAAVALLSLIPLYLGARGVGTFFSLGLMHIATAGAAMAGLTLFFQRCEDC